MCFRLFFLGGQNLCVSRYYLFGGQNLCASGFSFWGDRTYAFPDIIFLRWIEFMYFQIFFRGQNLCVSNHFLGDRIYVFPTIFWWIEFMCVSRYFS